jgi:diguanylate cyclase (GGDEF)-like protein
MIDPLTATAAATGLAFVGVASASWHLRRRVRRVEAQAARLHRQLLAEYHAANHDPLTGLPNRRGFFRRGDALVADPGRHPLVAVVLDLDDFKLVNDRFGHAVGDQVLVTVARRFADWAAYRGGPADTVPSAGNLVGRLGGDEFAGLLSASNADPDRLRHAAWRLTDLLAAPIPIAGHLVRVSVSVGMGGVPAASSLSDALHHADAAMYRAKHGGRPETPAATLTLTGASAPE